ncbi:MAG: alpha/beta fold hydrolase [bacterium]
MLNKNNTKSTKKSILKNFFIGCGTITALVIGFIIWVGVSLFSGPDAMEMSEYHPFRSQEAKEKYLQLYDERARLWPVVSETKTVETAYGPTFVRISGPVDAPPLVLLPGGGTPSLMWAPNIEALSADYRTYAVDNIFDIGRSVYTKPIKNPDDFVRWLDELFSALEPGDNINLMGLSYGGWLTSQYALRHPERLNKIVLLAPAATVLPFNQEFLKRAILSVLPHRYFLRSTIYWLFEDLAKKDEASRMLIDAAVDDAFLARQCFKFKMLVNPTVLTDEELQSLAVPALFLVGENEKIYSAKQAVQRLKAVSPQIKTEILPDCGHDLFIAQKDLVNERVLAFLE